METYKYYKETIREEHMLFSSEILTAYPIYSTSGKIHKLAMDAILNHTSDEKLYYNTKHGLRRVYPKAVYLTVLDFLDKQFEHYKLGQISVEIDDKTYTILKKGADTY